MSFTSYHQPWTTLFIEHIFLTPNKNKANHFAWELPLPPHMGFFPLHINWSNHSQDYEQHRMQDSTSKQYRSESNLALLDWDCLAQNATNQTSFSKLFGWTIPAEMLSGHKNCNSTAGAASCQRPPTKVWGYHHQPGRGRKGCPSYDEIGNKYKCYKVE